MQVKLYLRVIILSCMKLCTRGAKEQWYFGTHVNEHSPKTLPTFLHSPPHSVGQSLQN